MDLLHGIRTFVRVVEHGSFTQAAQALGTSPATVSRQVAGLEQALSARLLQRNTRSVVVTESGLRYYEHCKQILRTVAAAAADVEDSQSHASGRLRLHAVTELGLEHLMPLLVDYLDGHPDVSVDLTLAQGTPALLEEGLDVLITLGRTLPDSTLVARDLGQVFSVVCAAPEYLARHGVPRTPEDLLRHRCLNVAAPSCPQGWAFAGERGETLRRRRGRARRLPAARLRRRPRAAGRQPVAATAGPSTARPRGVRAVLLAALPGRQDPHLGGFPQGTPAPGVRA